jgi:hypothetical protein
MVVTKKWVRQKLDLIDIALLWVIYDHWSRYKRNPTKSEILRFPSGGGLWNEWLSDHDLPPVKASMRLQSSLNALREVKLLDPDERGYQPTEDCKQFFNRYGINWRRWPVLIPIEDGQLQHPIYMEE